MSLRLWEADYHVGFECIAGYGVYVPVLAVIVLQYCRVVVRDSESVELFVVEF